MELRSHKPSYIKPGTRDLYGNSYTGVLRNSSQGCGNISSEESANDQKYEDELLNELIRTGSQKSSSYAGNVIITKRSDTHSIRSLTSNNSSDVRRSSDADYRRQRKLSTDKDLEEGLENEIIDLNLAESSKSSGSVYSSVSPRRGFHDRERTEYLDKKSILTTSESDLDGERFPSYMTAERVRLQDNRRSHTSRHSDNKHTHKQKHRRSRDWSSIVDRSFRDSTNSLRTSRNMEEVEMSINENKSLSSINVTEKSGGISPSIKRSQTDVGSRSPSQNNYPHRASQQLSYHESIAQRTIKAQQVGNSKSTPYKNYSKRHSDSSLLNSQDRLNTNFMDHKSSSRSRNDSIFELSISEEPNQEVTSESGIDLHNGSGNMSRKTSRATHRSSSSRGSAVGSSTHQTVSAMKNEFGDCDSIGSASSIARGNSRMSPSSGSNIQTLEDPDEQICEDNHYNLYTNTITNLYEL